MRCRQRHPDARCEAPRCRRTPERAAGRHPRRWAFCPRPREPRSRHTSWTSWSRYPPRAPRRGSSSRRYRSRCTSPRRGRPAPYQHLSPGLLEDSWLRKPASRSGCRPWTHGRPSSSAQRCRRRCPSSRRPRNRTRDGRRSWRADRCNPCRPSRRCGSQCSECCRNRIRTESSLLLLRPSQPERSWNEQDRCPWPAA